MILKNSSFLELKQNIEDDSLFCFGIGSTFDIWLDLFGFLGWESKIAGLIDNNVAGKEKPLFGRTVIIQGLDYLAAEAAKRKINILITVLSYEDILEQLDSIKALDNADCYIYLFMFNSPVERLKIVDNKNYKIPATIHYCWFGRGEKPDLYKKCIDSWYRYCPDYEIIEWNEDNCDITENKYAYEAYSCKKYGFVPDYFRLKIIYEHGGIYLDTDVEVLKNLDPLRNEEAFCGRQFPYEVAFGLGFGAAKGNSVIKRLMKRYEEMSFIREDGTYNIAASPYYQTKDMIELGLKKDPRKQIIESMCVYPTDVLSPINIKVGLKEITENSFTIHHFDGSWVDDEKKKKKEASLSLSRELIERMNKNRG